MDNGYHSIGEAAKLVGVHKLTLYRWEREGKVAAPRRIKRNNQRVYTDEDIARLRDYKNEMVEPPKK